ncbi:hypothetical protein TNCV_1175781 [Trichonephila clavipes]|nr:hypothetical protein TNCV_1175781 [Trichonephila clavipes]
MSFTRRPGSRHPRQTSHREDSHISGAMHEETGLQRNGTRSSLATNPDSISAVMIIVFVCGDPGLNASILHLIYSDTPLTPTAGVMVWGDIAYNTQ